MAVEHARIRVIEDRCLHTPAEQRLRLAHEVLVERVVRGDEHCQPVTLPPGAAPLLAQAGHRLESPPRSRSRAGRCRCRARARRSRTRRAARRRRDDARSLCAAQACTRRDTASRSAYSSQPVEGEAMDELGCLAALREAQGAQPALDELSEQPRPSPSALARRFSSSSVTGGFQSTIVRSALGAESPETTVAVRPVNDAASSAGFAIVAEASRNCGSGRTRPPAAGGAAARSRRASRRRRGTHVPRRR